jgi:hypothetical protein
MYIRWILIPLKRYCPAVREFEAAFIEQVQLVDKSGGSVLYIGSQG